MKVSKKNYPYLYDYTTIEAEELKRTFSEDLKSIQDIVLATMMPEFPPIYYVCKTVKSHVEETSKVLSKVIPFEIYSDRGVLLIPPFSSIFYRIDKNDEEILVSIVSVDRSTITATELLKIVPKEEGLFFNTMLGGKMYLDGQEGAKEIMVSILSFSVWKKTAEVKFQEIGGKGRPKKGNGKKNERVYNDSLVTINQVDKTWYTSYEGTIHVRRHARLQAYGKGRKERKLIWIDPFSYEKRIRAKKTRFFNEKTNTK